MAQLRPAAFEPRWRRHATKRVHKCVEDQSEIAGKRFPAQRLVALDRFMFHSQLPLSGGISRSLSRVILPRSIELKRIQDLQGPSDACNKPVDAVVKGIPPGLIITVENFVAHHCLHHFAPDGRGGERGPSSACSSFTGVGSFIPMKGWTELISRAYKLR